MMTDTGDRVRAIHDALSGAGLEYSAYSCNGTNLFGDADSIRAATTAFHRSAQVNELQRSLRHWREECGKLHAQIAAHRGGEGYGQAEAETEFAGSLHDALSGRL